MTRMQAAQQAGATREPPGKAACSACAPTLLCWHSSLSCSPGSQGQCSLCLGSRALHSTLPVATGQACGLVVTALHVRSLIFSCLAPVALFPLQVASDRQCSQLVAQAVIHLMMGVQLECPLGLPTTARRRQAPAAAAPSPVAQPPRSVEAHAGGHASVFETVARAFARQRRHQAEVAAEATADALQELSVDGSGSDAAAPALAADEARGIAPGSPPGFEAPTPTAGAATSAAPAVAPVARVRNIGLGKRVSSRRTLFDTVNGASAASEAKDSSAASGKPSATAQAAAAPAGLHPAASAAATCEASGMLGGVALEMAMSPNRASVRAMEAAAAAAAAPLVPASWAGRKRLRFD